MHFSIYSKGFPELELKLKKLSNMYPGIFQDYVDNWESLALWSEFSTIVGLRTPIFKEVKFDPIWNEEKRQAEEYGYFPLRAEYSDEVESVLSPS